MYIDGKYSIACLLNWYLYQAENWATYQGTLNKCTLSPNVRALILRGVSLPEEVGQASLRFILYYNDLSLSWWGFGKDVVDSGFH